MQYVACGALTFLCVGYHMNVNATQATYCTPIGHHTNATFIHTRTPRSFTHECHVHSHTNATFINKLILNSQPPISTGNASDITQTPMETRRTSHERHRAGGECSDIHTTFERVYKSSEGWTFVWRKCERENVKHGAR